MNMDAGYKCDDASILSVEEMLSELNPLISIQNYAGMSREGLSLVHTELLIIIQKIFI